MPIGFLKKPKQPNELALKATILFTGLGYSYDYDRRVFAKGKLAIVVMGQEERGKSALCLAMADSDGTPTTPPIVAMDCESVSVAIEILTAYATNQLANPNL